MRIRDDHVRERISTLERLNGRLKKVTSREAASDEQTSRRQRDEKLRVVVARVLVLVVAVRSLTRIFAEIIWMRFVAQRFAMHKRLKAQENRMRARALMRGVRETALNAISIFMSEKTPR